MKFFVNEDCIGCGMCIDVCPKVFKMTEQEVAEVIKEELEIGLEAIAKEAMEGCPVGAIENK